MLVINLFYTKNNIKHLYTFNNSIFIINIDNELFGIGNNQDNKLGLNDLDEYIYYPDKIDIKENIKNIVSRDNSTCFLTNTNTIYITGNNNNNKLGRREDPNIDIIRLSKMILPEEINQVIFREYSTYYISNMHNVYIAGTIENGINGWLISRCGLKQPTKLNINEAINSIAFGPDATYFITNSNKIYVCGTDDSGSAGTGEYNKRYDVLNPGSVKLNKNIKKMLLFKGMSFFFDEDDTVWAAGCNICGRLGIGDNEKYKTIPTKVCIDKPIKHIIINNELRRTEFITTSNETYICGRNLKVMGDKIIDDDDYNLYCPVKNEN